MLLETLPALECNQHAPGEAGCLVRLPELRPPRLKNIEDNQAPVRERPGVSVGVVTGRPKSVELIQHPPTHRAANRYTEGGWDGRRAHPILTGGTHQQEEPVWYPLTLSPVSE